MITAIVFVVFPFAMIHAALSDIFTMTIANRVSLLLIAAFIAIAPFIGLSWTEFGLHLAAFALVLSVTFALFAAGVMGGGDAKLLASTALWMGLGPALMHYILMATVAGGILTLVLLVFRGSALAAYAGEVRVLRRLVDEKDIPYGVALAIGGLAAFPQSPAMIWAVAQAA
ncbi:MULTISPECIES: prepilin peptidase [unclassified Roseitalea]|uniref:A24 family peptidase n=1 Tax=unclassified Roseitalea TaxID=2639107 RepID=UPI002740093B|nr:MULTISPECIES: prepilin peptidase [unclassified Roseitalea]